LIIWQGVIIREERINQSFNQVLPFFLRAALLLQLSIFEGILQVWNEAVNLD